MDPIGQLVGWIAAYGASGLFAIGLAERFVPMIPSSALLLAIGAAAVEGVWLLPTAFLATTLGSVLGCIACFVAVGALGEARATRFVKGTGWLFGVSADGVEHRMASLRRNGTALAFSLQLVPTARFVAPALAALLRGRSQGFLVGSTAGIAVWNGVFIGVGYTASRTLGGPNATVLAVAILDCLVAAQVSLFWIARKVRAHRGSMPAPRKIR